MDYFFRGVFESCGKRGGGGRLLCMRGASPYPDEQTIGSQSSPTFTTVMVLNQKRNVMSKLAQSTFAMFVVVFLLSTPLLAQERQVDAPDKVKAEMEAAFGIYPQFMQVLPKHLQAAAWEMMKARGNPKAALSAKNSELIGLAVAAQVPCNYCVYFHTQMAKMLGASEEEIQEAVAMAAHTRHWSTVLNGAGIEFEAFKAEFDQMLAFLKKQSEAKQSSKK